MVFKKDIVIERLKELGTIVEELKKYEKITLKEIEKSLSKRWIIERGLIAGANVIFDISDYILSSKFSIYPDTYEETLLRLYEKRIISEKLYRKIKGFGSFRNILVHEYINLDVKEVYKNFKKAIEIFCDFSREIISSMT